MAAFVASSSTWNTTAGNKTVAPTPAVGELIVVVVAASGMTSGLTVADNQGGTYTQVGTFALNNTSADCVGVFVRNSLIASAVATTITAGESTSSGGGLAALRFSGMTRVGLAAIRTIAGVLQFAKQENQAAGTPAPAFPSAASTLNAVIGAVLTASNSTTNTAPPTGWTEQHDLGYTVPATGIEVATRDSGETGTTITWTAATPSIFASIIIELEAGVPHAELIAAEPNYNGLGRVSAFLDDEDAEHYDYYAPLHNATEAAIAGPPVGGGGPSDAELIAADPNYSGTVRLSGSFEDSDEEAYDYYGGSAPVVDTTLIIAPRMQAWIDFGDPSLLFTDTARTTPVAVANDLIRGVTDKSGNGQHLAQATNPPTYQPNAYRGLSASRWDGFAQKLQGPVTNSGFGYPQPITRIAVVRSTEVSAASRVAIGGQTATDPAGPWTFTGLWSAWAGSPTLSDGAQDNALHVITTVFNGGSSSIALEGIVKVTGTTGSGVVTRYEVGSYNDGTQLWLGDVCEFIDFQGILDPADLAYWVNYMVARWSVLTEVEFTPDQYPYETEPEHDYYSPLYDGAADAYTAGPPIVANDSYVAAVDTFDHSDQPDEDEAFDFYSQRFDGAVEAFIAGAPPPVINQSVDEVGVRWFTVSGINVSETGLRAPNGITDEVGRRVSLLSPETVTTDDSYIATNSFLGEQDTAYQADVDDEHYNFYAQRLDGSVEAFIAGPPVVADDYVATAASVLPDRGWDEADYYPELIVAEMVDGAEAVLGFLTVEDEIANAAQLDPAAGQDDDAWWTLTDPTDIAPFVEQAEAITGFLTVEDEIAEAAQLDRSVGQDDDQAWLAGDPTDVAPFIDGAEAILGFLTIEDEIAEAAQLPRDIGWFSEDFDQANDPTDITPFLDEQEELIAGPPLFADDGYIATVDVFDHSDEPAPDDAFDFYATTQEGTEWSIGFLAPDVEITIGAQPSRGEDTGLDNPDWDYTDDQSYVEQTEAVVGALAPDAEIAEAAQLDRSVGQDDDQAWIVTDPTDVWPFTDQAEWFTAGSPVTDDFIASAASHVESVAQDFPERIDDTEEQGVEAVHIQPEEYVAGSTPGDDPLYLAQTYYEQDIENAPAPDDAFDYSAAAGFVSTFPAYVPEPPQLRYDFDAFTLGLSDGAAVGTWPDASGRGSDAVQPTGSLQPLYVAAGINGHPAVRGDGIDDQLPVTNYTVDLQAWTIMAVVAPEVGDATSEDVITGGAAPGNSWFVDRSSSVGVPYASIAIRTSSGLNNLSGLGTAGIWPDRQGKLVTFVYDPTAGRSIYDGLQLVASDADTTHSDPPTTMLLFSRGGSLFFQGLIGQVRLWNYVLDPATRATEQQNLLTKWFDVADEVAEGQVTDDQASAGHYEWPPDATNEQPWLDQSEAFIAGPPVTGDDYIATTALVPDHSDQPAPDDAWDGWAYPVEASEWFIGFTAPDAEIADAAQDHTVGQDDDQLWTLADPTDAAPFVDGIEYLTGFLVPADEIAQAAQPHYGDWQDWRETEQTEDYANDSTIGVEDTTNAPDTFDLTAAAQPDPSIGQDWHLWPEWDYTADQPYASELDVAPLTFPADSDEVTQAAQPTAIGQDDDALWTLTDPTDIAPFTEQAEGFIAGPPDVFDTTIATQPDPSMGQDTDLLYPPDLSQLDTGYVEQAEGYVAGPPAFAPDAEAIASQPAETGIDVEGRWPEWDGTDATPFLDGAEWFIGFTVPDVEITIAAQPSRAEDTAIDNPDRIEWTEETDPAATLDLSPLVRADDPIEVTLATQLDASVGQDDDQWWTLLDPTDTTPFIDEQEEAIAGSTPADDPLYAAQAWPDVSTTEYAPEETTDYANDTARDLSALTPAPDSTDTTFAAQLDPSAGQDDDQGWIAADPTDIWPFTDQLEAFEEIVTPDEGIAATQDYSDAQYEPEALWAPESLSDGAIEFIASDIEQALLPAATALCEPAAEPEDEAWPIYLALSDQSGEFAATQLDIALVAALDAPAALVDEPEVWTPEVALADGIEVATTEIAVAVAAQPLVEAYDWTIFEEPVADLSTIERRPIVARPTAQPDIVPMVALVDPGVDLVALKDPEVGFPEGGGFSSGFSSGFARGGGTGELDALAESEGYAMGPYGAPAPDHVSALEGEVEHIDALSDPGVDVT